MPPENRVKLFDILLTRVTEALDRPPCRRVTSIDENPNHSAIARRQSRLDPLILKPITNEIIAAQYA